MLPRVAREYGHSWSAAFSTLSDFALNIRQAGVETSCKPEGVAHGAEVHLGVNGELSQGGGKRHRTQADQPAANGCSGFSSWLKMCADS